MSSSVLRTRVHMHTHAHAYAESAVPVASEAETHNLKRSSSFSQLSHYTISMKLTLDSYCLGAYLI